MGLQRHQKRLKKLLTKIIYHCRGEQTKNNVTPLVLDFFHLHSHKKKKCINKCLQNGITVINSVERFDGKTQYILKTIDYSSSNLDIKNTAIQCGPRFIQYNNIYIVL